MGDSSSETQPLMSSLKGVNMPKAAKWASAIPSQRGHGRYSLPQAIAHRGYRAAYPENSMAAFRGAVQVGAQALETDVHLSKDGVVVLSHDPSLKRCFGVDSKISDCDWSYLSSLRTLAAPHEPLARFSDLLEYLASSPETEKIWVLLDVKIDDKADELLGAVARTFTEVSSAVPWDERVIIACWNATFIKSALSLLPGFPLAHTSFSTSYSRHFLCIPNLGFNIAQRFLVGPFGSWFLHDVKKAGRPVFAWTVNEVKWMEWCIRRNVPKRLPAAGGEEGEKSGEPAKVFLDGVISDDPKLYLEVVARLEDELEGKASSAAATTTAASSSSSSTAIAPRKKLGLASHLTGSLGALCNLLFFNIFGTGFFLYGRFQGRFDRLDSKFLRSLRT